MNSEHTHVLPTSPASLLIVPGDSERKLQKADAAGADALILDLEDAVVQSRAPIARAMILDFLRSRPIETRRSQIWVRINPVQSGHGLEDLVEVVKGQPDVIVIPKVRSAADVELVSHWLYALETREGLPSRTTICPTLTETPQSLLNAAGFQSCGAQVRYMSWGPIDLAAALRASTNRRADGSYEAIYEFARGLCLLTARASGADPIDTICADYKNEDVLRSECVAARAAGFVGKCAIHPDQIPIIKAGFRPTKEEVEHAREVVQVFEQGVGTFGLNGQMYDKPHLTQAREVLSRASKQVEGGQR